MRIKLKIVAVAGALVVSVTPARAVLVSAPTLAVDLNPSKIAVNSGLPVSGYAGYSVGWTFTVPNTIDGNPISGVTIAGLALWDYQANGLDHSHPVGLWNNAGTLLTPAGFSIGAADPDWPMPPATTGWVYKYLDVAFNLAPGTYTVGAYFPNAASGTDPDRYAMVYVPGGFTATVPEIVWGDDRSSKSNGLTEPGLPPPSNPLPGDGIFSANLILDTYNSSLITYTDTYVPTLFAASVPDGSSSLILLSMAILGIAALSRGSRRISCQP